MVKKKTAEEAILEEMDNEEETDNEDLFDGLDSELSE